MDASKQLRSFRSFVGFTSLFEIIDECLQPCGFLHHCFILEFNCRQVGLNNTDPVLFSTGFDISLRRFNLAAVVFRRAVLIFGHATLLFDQFTKLLVHLARFVAGVCCCFVLFEQIGVAFHQFVRFFRRFIGVVQLFFRGLGIGRD